jgi:hypothetical protein
MDNLPFCFLKITFAKEIFPFNNTPGFPESLGKTSLDFWH